MKDEWKKKAEELFFDSKLSINEISGYINISVRSISSYLNSHPNYKIERHRRKTENQDRANYQKDWKKNFRKKTKIEELRKGARYINYGVNGETLRQEHITAVKILSRERFFNE